MRQMSTAIESEPELVGSCIQCLLSASRMNFTVRILGDHANGTVGRGVRRDIYGATRYRPSPACVVLCALIYFASGNGNGSVSDTVFPKEKKLDAKVFLVTPEGGVLIPPHPSRLGW